MSAWSERKSLSHKTFQPSSQIHRPLPSFFLIFLLVLIVCPIYIGYIHMFYLGFVVIVIHEVRILFHKFLCSQCLVYNRCSITFAEWKDDGFKYILISYESFDIDCPPDVRSLIEKRSSPKFWFLPLSLEASGLETLRKERNLKEYSRICGMKLSMGLRNW